MERQNTSGDGRHGRELEAGDNTSGKNEKEQKKKHRDSNRDKGNMFKRM